LEIDAPNVYYDRRNGDPEEAGYYYRYPDEDPVGPFDCHHDAVRGYRGIEFAKAPLKG
jgi:hypothetical protein